MDNDSTETATPMSQENELQVVVNEQVSSMRLDSALAELLQNSDFDLGSIKPTRSKIAKWIAAGQVRVNNSPILRASHKVMTGDYITFPIPEAEQTSLEPDPSVKLDIIYEDADILVLNKAPGIAVHPGAGNRTKTLVHGLLAHIASLTDSLSDSSRRGFERPGIVHRLDKDTSGVMVVAKNDLSYQHLVQQFLPPRSIHRTYVALVAKAPRGANSGVLDKPIGRDPRNRKRMAVVETGKLARTHWQLVERYRFGAMLELELETGRTHQIRVHLADCNSAILGDPVYGHSFGNVPQNIRNAIAALNRQALHAKKLSFIHPRSRETVAFTADMPEDMLRLLDLLRENT